MASADDANDSPGASVSGVAGIAWVHLDKNHPGRVTRNHADLILIDLDQLPFVPLNDLPRQLVYCEPARAVRHTIVAGDVVVRDGRLTHFDEQQIKDEARELAAEFVAYTEQCRAGVDQLAPFYAEMYRQANAQPMPIQRLAGPTIP